VRKTIEAWKHLLKSETITPPAYRRQITRNLVDWNAMDADPEALDWSREPDPYLEDVAISGHGTEASLDASPRAARDSVAHK
jgi:hypothetical protein